MSLYPTILPNLHKGESQLFEIQLIQSNDSELPFDSLHEGTKIEFYQNRILKKTLLLEGDELREGSTTNALEIEAKSETTALFAQGYPVFIRATLVATNGAYSASNDLQTDIKTYRIGNVL